MRAHDRTRSACGPLFVAAVLLASLLAFSGTCYALANDHDVPGKPMGPGGASGTVDVTTSPRDVYAVYLFAGQPVVFHAAWGPGSWAWNYIRLYAPGILTVETASRLAGAQSGNSHVFTYNPAVTGLYYLGVSAEQEHGVGYVITVSGKETLPVRTTTRASAAPSVLVGKTLRVTGTVSPSATPGVVTIVRTRLVGKIWKAAGSTRVGVALGKFAYSFKPLARGKWRIVCVYLGRSVGSSTYVTSRSPVRGLTVK